MLGVGSSVPANGIVFSHKRSFAVIVRGNAYGRAGPSWFNIPAAVECADFPRGHGRIAESCRRHEDWRQTSQRLCTALASSPSSIGITRFVVTRAPNCAAALCADYKGAVGGTHKLLLRTYMQLVVGYYGRFIKNEEIKFETK